MFNVCAVTFIQLFLFTYFHLCYSDLLDNTQLKNLEDNAFSGIKGLKHM